MGASARLAVLFPLLVAGRNVSGFARPAYVDAGIYGTLLDSIKEGVFPPG